MKKEPLKVLFASFEAAPFVKTGGLGDVAGSLPRYLNQKDCDVRLILPKLSCIPQRFVDRMEYVENYTVRLGWRDSYCGLFEMQYNGVTIYFLDNEYYFNRPGVYGEFDDGERVAFFSKAVLETLLRAQGVLDMLASIALPEKEDEYLTLDSVRFHTSLGFREIARFPDIGNKFGRWYSMVWMDKVLGEHGPEPRLIIPIDALGYSPEKEF